MFSNIGKKYNLSSLGVTYK